MVIGSPQELKAQLGQHYSLQVVLAQQAAGGPHHSGSSPPPAFGVAPCSDGADPSLGMEELKKLPIGVGLELQAAAAGAHGASSWADGGALRVEQEEELLLPMVEASGAAASEPATDPRVTHVLAALQEHFPGAQLREAHMGTASFSLPAKGLSLATAFTVGVLSPLSHTHSLPPPLSPRCPPLGASCTSYIGIGQAHVYSRHSFTLCLSAYHATYRVYTHIYAMRACMPPVRSLYRR